MSMAITEDAGNFAAVSCYQININRAFLVKATGRERAREMRKKSALASCFGTKGTLLLFCLIPFSFLHYFEVFFFHSFSLHHIYCCCRCSRFLISTYTFMKQYFMLEVRCSVGLCDDSEFHFKKYSSYCFKKKVQS